MADKLRNPYSPPGASVADADARARRVMPSAVRRAVILMLISFALDSIAVALEWRHISVPESPLRTILQQAGALLVTGWLAWKIASGRHWARVVVLIVTVISLPALFAGAITSAWSSAYLAGLMLVEMGLDIAVVYLVFFPGHDFFKPPAP